MERVAKSDQHLAELVAIVRANSSPHAINCAYADIIAGWSTTITLTLRKKWPFIDPDDICSAVHEGLIVAIEKHNDAEGTIFRNFWFMVSKRKVFSLHQHSRQQCRYSPDIVSIDGDRTHDGKTLRNTIADNQHNHVRDIEARDESATFWGKMRTILTDHQFDVCHAYCVEEKTYLQIAAKFHIDLKSVSNARTKAVERGREAFRGSAAP
jgi:DNA-directed RNA polymerase specialized sigma subunit